MSKRELWTRVLSSLAGTAVLTGLMAIGYGIDWWAMLHGGL